jgi:hypothetical protein
MIMYHSFQTIGKLLHQLSRNATANSGGSHVTLSSVYEEDAGVRVGERTFIILAPNPNP